MEKTSAKKTKTSELIIEVRDRKYVYDQLKIVSKNAPLEKRLISKINITQDPDTVPPAIAADPIIRVVMVGKSTLLLTGHDQLARMMATEETSAMVRIVSFAQLQRTEVPPKKLPASEALNLLTGNERFKVKEPKKPNALTTDELNAAMNPSIVKKKEQKKAPPNGAGFFLSPRRNSGL